MRLTPLAAVLVVLSLAAPAAHAGPTVPGALRSLLARDRIDRATHDRHRAAYDDAVRTARRLGGARRVALRGALRAARDVADAGALDETTARAVFLTLRVNRDWWARRPLLGAGARVFVPGSRLVWQHYPGEGLHIQWLGTFGRANALFAARTMDDDLRALLDEAVSLAASRDRGIAFEYLFRFDRGRPPWVSGLAQATAAQALARGAVRLGDPRYFAPARGALGPLRTAPPQGVAAKTRSGTHFLLYSFRPDIRVANSHVGALNGVWDFAALANDAPARALFARGWSQLRAELPGYSHPGWSRYSNLRESDLGYHQLLRDFLRGLCRRLEGSDRDPRQVCETADRLSAQLRQPPRLTLRSRRLRARRTGALRFWVSKPSLVTVTLRREGELVLRTAVRVGSGRRAVSVRPRRSGALEVELAATDLAGNAAAVRGRIEVLRAR